MAYLDSEYWDILTACQQQVFAISELLLAPSQVRVRKRPSFQKDHDSLPFVCISPEAESIDQEMFDTGAGTGNLLMAYPVLVTLLTESKFSLEDLQWQLFMRQGIRRKLHKAGLTGASGVYDCRSVDLSPIFDLGGLDAAFDVSGIKFIFHNAEARQEAP